MKTKQAAKRKATPPPAADPSPDDRELALRLGAVMLHVLGSEGGAAVRVIDESGLSFVQAKTVFILGGEELTEQLSVKLVAERLSVSVPSASRAVDGLVKRGFATRVEDPDDRRVRRIALSQKGRDLSDRLTAARLAGLENFAAGLSAAERRKLDAALAVLLERDAIADIYKSHATRSSR